MWHFTVGCILNCNFYVMDLHNINLIFFFNSCKFFFKSRQEVSKTCKLIVMLFFLHNINLIFFFNSLPLFFEISRSHPDAFFPFFLILQMWCKKWYKNMMCGTQGVSRLLSIAAQRNTKNRMWAFFSYEGMRKVGNFRDQCLCSLFHKLLYFLLLCLNFLHLQQCFCYKLWK